MILTTCGDEGGFEVCVGLAVVGLTVVGLTVVGLTLGDVDGDFVGEVVGTQSEPQKGPCISSGDHPGIHIPNLQRHQSNHKEMYPPIHITPG